MASMTRWLDVEVGTDDIDLNTLPCNVALVDLHNDGEIKLLVGDLGRADGPKLKIFRGTMQLSDVVLPDLPLGVVGLYTSETTPRSAPFIGVAFSSGVHIYRNMRLFFKYYLPTLELNASEMDIWKQLKNPENQTFEGIQPFIETLKQMPPSSLSLQTRNFIAMNTEQQMEYLEQTPNLPEGKPPEIACITTLKLSSTDKYAANCLVVGSEESDVVILDPQTFIQISQARICAAKKAPYQMVATGLYNVEYRITIATREKCVCLLKRDWAEGRVLFTTVDHIVAIEVMPADSSVLVICADNTLSCYSKKACAGCITMFSFTVKGPVSTLEMYVSFEINRDKCVCLLKRDWAEGRVLLLPTTDHIVAIEVMPADNSVLVICADNTLSCYSKKGKKQWSISLEHRPVSMTLLHVMHLGVTLTAVALASGHVHLYDGRAKRDTVFVTDVASVMKFGQLGQEEHVFIIVTGSGNLMLKILKRTADFHAHAAGVAGAGGGGGGAKPWLIPKKSKLFLEQTLRERENAVDMHETFQDELIRLRLLASKTLLEAHLKSDNSIGAGALEPVRLSAEVEGMGPVFRVTLIVENTSQEKAVIGLAILFHVPPTDYTVSNPYIKVPLLSPGAKLHFPTKVEEIFSADMNPEVFLRSVSGRSGERSLVKVVLLKEGRARPVLAATVQVPPTDPMMLPLDKLQTGFNEN